MVKRYVSVWFPHLKTDWFFIRKIGFPDMPVVVVAPLHGRMLITAANIPAQKQDVYLDMALADARVLIPTLQVIDDIPGLNDKLLKRIAEWCIRFTPVVAIDMPDGLILDVTGCSHLWGSDQLYLSDVMNRLKARGYHIQAAMANTIGAAWALARFGNDSSIIEDEQQIKALLPLPPQALRLETETVELLNKLGLRQINDFIGMPRSALRRRFGQHFIQRLDQALGYEDEIIDPLVPVEQYEERLPCLEPVITLTGIEIATERLLTALCDRLAAEQKGLRNAFLKCYRTDGKIEKIEISTNHASNNSMHLFKLFELKFQNIEPAPGIEFFLLEAKNAEKLVSAQEKLWGHASGLKNVKVAELLDRIAGRVGENRIHRYLPDEHHWPERSYKKAASIHEKPSTPWKISQPRPVQLMKNPEPIAVTAPVPDYPPMLFRYKGNIHKIIKADGPERIEQEWWLQDGPHRDYYIVEDEKGNRYWIFRLGHYGENNSHQWFLHGFFA